MIIRLSSEKRCPCPVWAARYADEAEEYWSALRGRRVLTCRAVDILTMEKISVGLVCGAALYWEAGREEWDLPRFICEHIVDYPPPQLM